MEVLHVMGIKFLSYLYPEFDENETNCLRNKVPSLDESMRLPCHDIQL